MNKFAITKTNNPSVNLALEESFFKDNSTDVVVYLWQNDNTIVIGNNQNSFLECNIPECKKDNVKIVRRMSGGGAVFHDLGNLNFTFIFNNSQHDIGEFLNIITKSLKNLGIDGIESQRNDLIIEGKKFSGHAYYKEDDRFLFHGTLLIDSNLKRLGKYLTPSITKLQNKGINSVRKRVINLSELVEVDIPRVIEEIQSETEKAFPGIEKVVFDDTYSSELSSKYADLKLLESQNPDSTLRMDLQTELGNFSLLINTKEEMIEKLEIFSDALIKPDYTEFINSHVYTKFDEIKVKNDFIKAFSN